MAKFIDADLEKLFLETVQGTMTVATRRALESRFRGNVAAQIRKLGGMAQPIETSTAVGVPDLYCIVNGTAFWMELKMCDGKVGSVARLKFQPGQRKWLLDNMLAGGKSLVGVHYLNGYAFARADAVANTKGAIPFGDPRFKGYILTQNVLSVKGLLTWMEHAFTLPLLASRIDEQEIKLSQVLIRERHKFDRLEEE